MPTVQSATALAYPAGNPPTLSVTIPSTSGNRCLICTFRQSGGTPPTIASVKYGGVDLTLAVQNSNVSNSSKAAIYYLINPTVGTANLVVTFSGSALGAFSIDAYVLTDVDQTTPIETSGTSVNSPSPVTETLTVTASAMMIDVYAGGINSTGGVVSATGGQTQVSNVRDTTGFVYMGSSYKTGLSSGSQSLTWTYTSAASWDSAFVSVKHSTFVAPGKSPAKTRLVYGEPRRSYYNRRGQFLATGLRTRLQFFIRIPRRALYTRYQRPVRTFGQGQIRGNFSRYAPVLPLRTGNKILAPFNTKETVREHFASRGWTKVNDQVNAGYPFYAQPVPQNGTYEEIIDYGTVFTNSIINVDWATSIVTGTVNVQCQISTSTDNITWSTPVVGTSLFVPTFRYVKITLTFTAVN